MQCSGEVKGLKVLLDEKRRQDLTPPEGYSDRRHGYKAYNCQIEGARKV